jgi:hypothetical protein
MSTVSNYRRLFSRINVTAEDTCKLNPFFFLKVGVGQTQAWMSAYVSILRIPQMI